MIKPMEPRLTVKDLARLSRVSLRVVTEILSGRPSGEKVRFSEKARERVMAVVRKYDYRPNRSARNLQNRRHNSIAAYVGPSIYHVHDHTLNKLLECCRKKGIFPVIETFSRNDAEVPFSLREHAVDGAIVFADMPEVEPELERKKLPVIYVNTNRRDGRNCITYDENGGIGLALEHFKGKNRQNTGMIHGQTDHYSGKSRLDAMFRRLGNKFPSLEISSRFETHEQRQGVIGEMRNWLDDNKDVDSVILGADVLAPLFYEAAARTGRKIPDGISVIAYNDLGVSQLIQPEVTALAVDYSSLAELSFNMLCGIIDGRSPRGPVSAPYQLIRRQSA